ncbi:uncharacterized protein MONOS_15225 [Monocercomonoides exilis]|uniref:uncharacterized protein n=1 Tax=Monocercomonoides exilis TaxID=2049356 RepID=UPI003559A308|nr:hypothetical protein MONOS_15225 [Monocercomonoides exilis]|eukprot:MONOS_15225.1-p1 / transcript=MONOS_15225.1 / gene=MONOS_15225 / organism=Monocercomonoides_exilis_PA203 / gene_product=unspecified product / transcript_product=unspecified product / location=Mono_scaffold01173:11030-11458(-) / protein_length=73 / sequence_SO=supercontig / SO=protein_coding / is_pseudo=false
MKKKGFWPHTEMPSGAENKNKTLLYELGSDVCKGGRGVEEGGASDPEDVADGRGDVVDDCGERSAEESGEPH